MEEMLKGFNYLYNQKWVFVFIIIIFFKNFFVFFYLNITFFNI
jgi:hypothetical protein